MMLQETKRNEMIRLRQKWEKIKERCSKNELYMETTIPLSFFLGVCVCVCLW